MKLKNYTSEVPASRSMARIEEVLVEAGATDISKKFKDNMCFAITFRLEVSGMPMFFKVPANVDACYKVMYAEYKKPTPQTAERVKEQAYRTAWKIISDWAEVQISMILLEQAKAIQIFLPFVYDPAKDQTFFERLEANKFKQLTN